MTRRKQLLFCFLLLVGRGSVPSYVVAFGTSNRLVDSASQRLRRELSNKNENESYHTNGHSHPSHRPSRSKNIRRREILATIFRWGFVPTLAGFPVPARAKKDPCVDGAIVAEEQVLGAYQQECFLLPERVVRLKSINSDVTIEQGLATSGSKSVVTGRTGVAVWNSCLLLTRFLDSVGRDLVAGKTVFELGCGAGLASIAVAKLGARHVVASDGNAEIVELAKANVARNDLTDVVETVELRWGSLDATDYFDSADIVVGSDLTYNAGTWKLLGETLSCVLKPGGIFIYATLGHSGFNPASEIGGFLAVTQSEGLTELVEASRQWPLRRSAEKILEECLSTNEKAIIDSTGGARVILLQKII